MIKTAGANVSPAELEVQLRACEPVKLARVVGVPDERLEQLVVLCVVLKEGATAAEDDIKGFLRERVAPYKVPKRVLFFEDGVSRKLFIDYGEFAINGELKEITFHEPSKCEQK